MILLVMSTENVGLVTSPFLLMLLPLLFVRVEWGGGGRGVKWGVGPGV